MATHIATGAVRKVRSDDGGHYSFQALPIGSYEVAASQAGFKRVRRTDIELHISDKLLIDLVLEVGELAQEVTVSASSAQAIQQSPPPSRSQLPPRHAPRLVPIHQPRLAHFRR